MAMQPLCFLPSGPCALSANANQEHSSYACGRRPSGRLPLRSSQKYSSLELTFALVLVFYSSCIGWNLQCADALPIYAPDSYSLFAPDLAKITAAEVVGHSLVGHTSKDAYGKISSFSIEEDSGERTGNKEEEGDDDDDEEDEEDDENEGERKKNKGSNPRASTTTSHSFQTTIAEGMNLHHAFERIFSTSETIKSKQFRISVRDSIVTISLAYWPFGWLNYSFVVVASSTANDDDDDHDEDAKTDRNSDNHVKLALSSPKIGSSSSSRRKESREKRLQLLVNTTSKDRSKQIRVGTTAAEYDTSNKVKFECFFANLDNRIAENRVQRVSAIFMDYLRAKLEGEVELYKARGKQRQIYQKIANSAAKERKIKELDRVIHPEKYRTKSATVRRAVGSGGSSNGAGGGRYRPSAAAQARRTVRSS